MFFFVCFFFFSLESGVKGVFTIYVWGCGETIGRRAEKFCLLRGEGSLEFQHSFAILELRLELV